MKNALFGIAALAAAAVTQSCTAQPPQCWSNGAAVPCAAPPAAGLPATQPTYYPQRRQYPPEWYYNPTDVPWKHCNLCGQ